MKRRRKRMHRQKPGAVPGTLTPPPESGASDANLISYASDRFEARKLDGGIETPQTGVLWIDMEGLSDIATIEKLGKQFHLHRLSLEDIFFEKRPKAEFHDDYVQLCLPMYHAAEFEQVAMFVGRGFVLTFQEGTPGDALEPVRQRLREGKGIIRSRGADYLAYALLDAVIDAYFPTVDNWSLELTDLEEELLASPNPRQVDAIRAIRRKGAQMKRMLRPLRDALSSILHHGFHLFHENTLPFYRDCHDHVVELLESLTAQRELTSELLDIYQSRLDQQTNEAMQTLTVIATIFIPLSFIAGVYGMNFDVSSPWNMPELRWGFGYPLVLGFMAVIGVSQYTYFKRKGWLSRTQTGAAGIPEKTK